MKGTKSGKIGIIDAFNDRHDKTYNYVNFMRQEWEDHNNNKNIVEDVYNLNRSLIDLTAQPQEIKDAMDEVFSYVENNPKTVPQVGVNFVKFCSRYDLRRISELPNKYVDILKEPLS